MMQTDTCTIPPPPAPPPAILSPPQPSDGSPACFSNAPAGSHWCGATHPGQQGYDADSGAAMAAAAGGNWQLNPTFGWHFCGLTLDECKDACVGMGGCAELLVVSANGCCFPARSSCDGAKLPNEKKYVSDTCTIPPPPAPPPAILSPPQPS